MAVFVEPAVTPVETERPRSRDISDELAALAARVSASVVGVRGSQSGAGSGVVWDASGLIVTNAHVVPGDWAEVEIANGARLKARVTARSVFSSAIAAPLCVAAGEPAVIDDLD